MSQSYTGITLGGTTIKPGQRASVELDAGYLYTHTPMTMPVQVACGKKTGPCLLVSAAIHGDEIVGVEIVRRLLKHPALRYLRGTLIAVPIVNVYGFINRSRYLPDRRDLNRAFPGSEKGSLAARLADLFMQEVINHCSHAIDLHSGAVYRKNLPQIRATLNNPETERLAKAFGAPVILDSNLRDGSLRQTVAERGIPMLLYEGGEALRFDEVAIRSGLQGIINVMRAIDMLPRSRTKKAPLSPLIAQSTVWIRAEQGGILDTKVALGKTVNKGQQLGIIADPFGKNEEKVLAPVAGVVICCTRLPLVNEGDALFHLAQLAHPSTVEATIEAFEAQYHPDTEGPITDHFPFE